MTVNGNAGLELTDERLIPFKPRYLSLQESLLCAYATFPYGAPEVFPSAVWKQLDDGLITARKMKDEFS